MSNSYHKIIAVTMTIIFIFSIGAGVFDEGDSGFEEPLASCHSGQGEESLSAENGSY